MPKKSKSSPEGSLRMLLTCLAGECTWTHAYERTLRTLLRRRVSIPNLTSIEQSPHHSILVGALHNGMYDLVPLFIDRGADPYKQGIMGRDPLQTAMLHYKNDPDKIAHIIRILLEEGVDPYAFSEGHGSAMELAAMNNMGLLTYMVEQTGADRLNDPVNEEGMTVLIVASYAGTPQHIALLLDYGADIDLPDQEGNTPLHHAIGALAYPHRDSFGRVHMLVTHGAELELPNREGKTPLRFIPNDEALQALHPHLTRERLRSMLYELSAPPRNQNNEKTGGRTRTRTRKTRKRR